MKKKTALHKRAHFVSSFLSMCSNSTVYSVSCMCVCVCVSLCCSHLTGVEVSPSGLFNRHQLSFVLQEMDAADYYPRIHKYFMGEAEVIGADEFSL